jgi:predicted DsbA family dithiol-disulfide isomerase
VRWRAFPLHPDTPEEGQSLEDLFANSPVDVKKMIRHLKKTAMDLALPFGEREKTYNSRLAQELGLWAETQNRSDAFHMATFKAYFVEGKNIAKIPVLLDLADSAGLSRKTAAVILEERSFAEAVDSDWKAARMKGITAVPTFLMNFNRLVGAQPYEALEKMMTANHVEKRRYTNE